jgi:hypothetical protein
MKKHYQYDDLFTGNLVNEVRCSGEKASNPDENRIAVKIKLAQLLQQLSGISPG